MKLQHYTDAQAFLSDVEPLLLQHEVENNMILGACATLRNSEKARQEAILLAVHHDGQLLAVMVQLSPGMSLIAGFGSNAEAAELIADFYNKNEIETGSVFGQQHWAEQFAQYYHKTAQNVAYMLVHRLEVLQNLSLPSGKLETATHDDVDWLIEWTKAFEIDAKIAQRKTREQIEKLTKTKLDKQHIVKWIDGGEVMSIAAIMRTTPNAASVGLVYTPPVLRGRGYATACVHALSAQILNSGLRYCGLFTDKNNPTSNKIYQKIGYEPLWAFCDIAF